MIRLKPEKEEEYREMHANAWPDVLATLKRAGVFNYSIFHRDGMLFSYLEFSGEDFEYATELMASDEATRKWWSLTTACQEPVETAATDEWWAPAEEVFHLD